jgi:hypothetical protein
VICVLKHEKQEGVIQKEKGERHWEEERQSNLLNFNGEKS